MEKSQLAQLIRTFSPTERREIRKFLRSPFFNVRTDVVQLFDWFCENESPDKGTTKQRLYGDHAPPDETIRLTMTYLMRLLERYMAQKEFETDDVQRDLRLTAALRKRGLEAFFERQKKRFEKALEAQPWRDEVYYETQFQLHWEAHQLASMSDPAETALLRAATQAADIAYFARRLRLTCLLAIQQSIYRTDHRPDHDSALIAFAESSLAAEAPVIAIYLHCYRMIQLPDEEAHFHRFKKMLLDNLALFPPAETRNLFIWAINYCVRQLNQGQAPYFQEAADLYKAGIGQGILLENGVISRYTYYNIVAVMLQTGDLEWIDYFIHAYKNNLEKKHRESAFSFTLARLRYAQGQYDAVLDLLQKANYHDPLLNLATKTLLLKTWYELGEFDTLQSHLDAMRNYIRRKRVLGYHRTNYLNIIKYTDKLLNSNRLDKMEIEKLRVQIVAEENLTERAWLLEKV